MLKIKNIKYDEECYGGCETCDYGSEYISDIEIILEDDTTIKINTNQMYEYTLTESDYMKLLANSKDIDDFYINMFELIASKSYGLKERISLEDMTMSINDKEIDIYKSYKEKRLITKRTI